MRNWSIAIVSAALIAGSAVPVTASAQQNGPPVTSVAIECNWGKLTMQSIQNGFDQGAHSADPSGDGFGPGTADEPRQGLANVLERGNLQALCELIADMIDNP